MAELLTINEVADRLKCSRDTVHRLINRGELPTTRVGTRPRISEDALADYLAQGAGDSGLAAYVPKTQES